MVPAKFRAWHTGQKEMFTGLYLDFNGRVGMWNHEETEIEFGEYPYLVVMQHSGVNDIYEGDIIQSENTHVREFRRVVGFRHGQFGYEPPREPGAWYPLAGRGATSKWVVIGNIYENPELLAEVK